MNKFFQPVFLLFLLLASAAQAQNVPRHVQVQLTPAKTHIAAGEMLPIVIQETIDPGWHTYWLNPGDAGQAPEVRWTLPAGFHAGVLHYPAPEKMPEGSLVTYGYEDQVALLQAVIAPAHLPKGSLTLTANIGILVCKDICIPEETTYTLTLNDSGVPPDNSAAIAAVQKTVIDDGAAAPAAFAEDHGDLVLTVAPPPADIGDHSPVAILPLDWGAVDNAAMASADLDDEALTVRQKRGERPLKELKQFRVLLSYRDSEGDSRVSAYSATPQPLPPRAALSFWRAALLALLGGIILNLMPCVFPVLSLKALKLCSLQGRELNEARAASLFYTAGILFSFIVLAVLLTALRAGGQHIGWGFQLQNPAFVLPLAWLLFLIGLNLSGYYEVTGRFANAGGRWAAGHGHAASFFTGVLAAVVATPCTAPFMGIAIGYALTQGPVLTLVIFLALGLGLALPLLALACVPALRAWLPRPGPWMVTFRELLAFPLYLSAAWLVWVFSLQAGPGAVMAALSGAVALVLALWLWNKARGRLAVRLLAVLAALSAFAVLPMAGTMEKQAMITSASSDWQPYSAASFAALEKGDAPIFVDMTAAWCITCKLNESTVLHTAAIMELFHTHNVQTVQGDWTSSNPEITDFLKRHGRNGVPLYVYYGPRDGKTGTRPDPVVLPQLLTAGIVDGVVGK